jgi:outer membrane protein TolC
MAERGALALRLAETMTLPRLDVGSSRLEAGGTFPEPGRMAMPRADFGVREAQVSGMRANAESLAAAAKEMGRKTAADARRAWFDTDAARRRLANLEDEVVPLAKRSFDAARGAYEGGRTGYLDLLEAARRQLSARKDLATARKNLAHALAALLRVTGRNGEER